MRYLLLIISLLFTSIFFAQNQRKIDSLKSVISNTKEAQARVLEYLELGNLYADIDSTFAYYHKALALSRKIKFHRGISHSLSNLASWNGRYVSRDSAILTHRSAIKELKQYNFKSGIANHSIRLGHWYARQQQQDSANKYKILGIDQAFESKDRNAILTAVMISDPRESEKNSYQSALRRYFMGDSICRTTDSLYYGRKCASIYERIGDIFYILNETERSKKYYLEAKSIHEFLGHPDGIQNINFSISGIYRKEEEYDKALELIDEAINYYEKERPEGARLLQALPERASIYSSLGNFELAEKDYLKMLELALNRNNDFYISRANISVANFYNKTKSYQKALKYAQTGFEIAKKTDNKNSQLLAIKIIIKANKKLNNYQHLSQNWEDYVELRDSVDYAKLRSQVNELETKYQTQKKEQEIELLNSQKELVEQQKNNQRNLLLGGIGITALAGIFFFFQYRNRQKTNKKLRELDTLKSNFFANISHEFRTPLTLIATPIQEKLEKGTLNKIEHKSYSMMQRNTTRLLGLVDQLLDLSKIEAGNLKIQVQQGDVLKHIAAILDSFTYPSNKKNINYLLNINTINENVWFDKDAVEKIITNLISNAIKYTPNNGTVVCSAFIKNANLHIEVKNTGKGLSKEQAKKVFNRFYQVDSHQEGTGIGLALVNELVLLHKGNIKVQSSPNDWTIFFVSLPVSKKAFTKDEIKANTSIDTNYTKLQKLQTNVLDQEIETNTKGLPILLIVEDNEDVRLLLTNTFKNNFDILLAKNGEEGIEQAIEHIPDIIISDIMMPIKDGIQLTNTLKNDEKTSHIPIILLTAKAGDENEFTGIKSGADDYITKPFNSKILTTKVAMLIELRKQLQSRYSQEVILKPKDISITPLDEQFFEKVQEVLDKKLVESSFNIEDFSNAVAMSRMQLHRKLKALTGLSATEFIRSQRLKLAAELLKKSDINISQVGYSVGFNDHSYFTKCFKEAYNCTPTQFAKNSKKSS